PPLIASARTWKLKSAVPRLAPWISLTVLPSEFPGASSGSLLVTETSRMLGSATHPVGQCGVTTMSTILWLCSLICEGFNSIRKKVSCPTPVQTPDWQLSPVVQELPSSQRVPLGRGKVGVQSPDVVRQVETVMQGLGSPQKTGCAPTH